MTLNCQSTQIYAIIYSWSYFLPGKFLFKRVLTFICCNIYIISFKNNLKNIQNYVNRSFKKEDKLITRYGKTSTNVSINTMILFFNTSNEIKQQIFIYLQNYLQWLKKTNVYMTLTTTFDRGIWVDRKLDGKLYEWTGHVDSSCMSVLESGAQALRNEKHNKGVKRL